LPIDEVIMAQHSHNYIPAAGHDWLLPFYDPFNWLLGGDALRRPLVKQGSIEAGHRILDIGCGTGALTILIKQTHPQADVVGLDPDPKALEIARRKMRRAGLSIAFVVGYGSRLDYADATFDRVFSSLMLHHLMRDEKVATLREVKRVLKPTGSLHVLDFGPPRSALTRAIGPLMHNAGHVKDNVEGRIPAFMKDAGFTVAEEVAHRNTLIGSMSYYRGMVTSS
jgi:ubiquinone/menaquinone biosynthesis C-methylase UbiE